MNKVCKSSDWKVQLKAKKKPRFKPGSELSDKVNIMNVDIEENEDDQHKDTSINIEIEKESKERVEISVKSKGKTRFKAGSDLTEKVNEMDIELIEEINEDVEISEVKLITRAKENVHRSIDVRRKSKPRFKPGTDLTDKVNKVAVDITEVMEDEFEVCEITIQITCKACALVETAAELN
jgi:nucleoid DNA-binding protein